MEANPSHLSTYSRLRVGDPESDEFMQQYLLFHYDFNRTEGFGIEWDKFDFFFPHCCPYDGAPPLDPEQTNEEGIMQDTLTAIANYNERNGTSIVFVEHIEANFYLQHIKGNLGMCSFDIVHNRITFRGKDMSSFCPEPKIYQAHIERYLGTNLYFVHIFRVKPTDEEMAAAPPIHVDAPHPYRFDCSKPFVVFCHAAPGDLPVPGTPFIFKRISPPIPGMRRPGMICVTPIPENWRDLPPWRRE